MSFLEVKNKIQKIIGLLGPGLVYAGAAVGVSHLVSATKAGAKFNYEFLYAIIIIHIIKYQFFKFGPLYTSITGKNILNGYKKVGKWSIYAYMIMTTISMCIIQAAVTIVTAGLISSIIPIGISEKVWALILLIICGTILLVGRYKILEKLSKVIIISLTLITIIAVALLFGQESPQQIENYFSFSNKNDIIFLIIFLGWMPAPMEVSVWHSIWAEKKFNSQNKEKNIKNTLFDFKIGFIGTAILAIIFTILGAKTLYGTNVDIPNTATPYAKLLIEMYSKALSPSLGIIIAIVAFLTMFSTTLTCLDASPRSLNEAQKISSESSDKKDLYKFLVVINIIGSVIILFYFIQSMASMIKLATIISFIATPCFALLNYLAITNKDIDKEYYFSNKEKIFSIISIITLIIFNILYFIFC